MLCSAGELQEFWGEFWGQLPISWVLGLAATDHLRSYFSEPLTSCWIIFFCTSPAIIASIWASVCVDFRCVDRALRSDATLLGNAAFTFSRYSVAGRKSSIDATRFVFTGFY